MQQTDHIWLTEEGNERGITTSKAMEGQILVVPRIICTQLATV